MSPARSTIIVLTAAGFVGGIIGGLSALPSSTGSVAARAAAVVGRPSRSRAPQPGDHWDGCNDARAAGTAPIYRDEPGYRPEMDGDGDGIACEPHHD